MSERARAWVVGLVVGVVGLALAFGIGSGLGERASEADRVQARERERAADAPGSTRARAERRHESRLASEQGRRVVVGHVIDRDDGPLAEGSVVLDCPDGSSLGRATIDEEGWFEGPACPRSPTCVQLIHPGSVQSRAWQLDADEPVELEVDPAPRVAGTVVADGQPIAAARVVARQGDRRWTASTDLAGDFMLTLGERARAGSACEFEPSASDQPVAVLVLAPGRRPWVGTVPAAGDEELDIALAEPAPALTGKLSDPEGRGFDRTRVLASSRDRPDEGHVAQPDPAGRFEFDGLGEGVYRLRAIRDGVELARGEGEASAKVVMVSTLSARGPTLELTLRDEVGEPVSGVRVDGGPFQAARTDDAGHVTATDVFAGAYDLRLRPSAPECGVLRERIEIPASADGQTIHIDLVLACEPDTLVGVRTSPSEPSFR